MTWTILGWALPWFLLGCFFLLGVREPRPLPPFPKAGPLHTLAPFGSSTPLPSVTIVVPARNEARNIVGCVTSLSHQEYPDFEIVVVNDASTDETGLLARGVPRGNARAIRVVDGGALPEGWFGKPWACTQGARGARSDLLLFTDADTRHAPDLLRRAVEGMREDDARALTLNGRQIAATLGERLIQPQIFALIWIRFPRLDRPFDPKRAGDAIANGQYILVERKIYEKVGGHEAVRGEVAEDLRLAQELTAAGHTIVFRNALDSFSTRMYQSLREAVEGWTKNVAVGGRQAAGRLGALAPLGMFGFLLLFWILPPLTLVGLGGAELVDLVFPDLAGYGAGPASRLTPANPILLWSGLVSLLSVIIWIGLYRRFRLPAQYAVLYPVGASIAAWIAIRSWIRGARRIEWRGRRYSTGRGTLEESSRSRGDR